MSKNAPLTRSSQFIELCLCQIVLVFLKMSVGYFQPCASLDVQGDATGGRRGSWQTREKIQMQDQLASVQNTTKSIRLTRHTFWRGRLRFLLGFRSVASSFASAQPPAIRSDHTECMTAILHRSNPPCLFFFNTQEVMSSNTYLRGSAGTGLISDLQVPASL